MTPSITLGTRKEFTELDYAGLDYLGWHHEAAAIDAAVQDAVTHNQGTQEIGGALGTRETGDYIAARIRAREIEKSALPPAGPDRDARPANAQGTEKELAPGSNRTINA